METNWFCWHGWVRWVGRSVDGEMNNDSNDNLVSMIYMVGF